VNSKLGLLIYSFISLLVGIMNVEDNNGSYASVQNLKKIQAYVMSRQLAKLVWDATEQWQWFAKKTIGCQWTEATDSITANIAEGYGAYFFNDTIKFYYYSRRSLFESCDWFGKAKERKLLSQEEITKIQSLLEQLPFELNKLIKRVRINKENLKIKQ